MEQSSPAVAHLSTTRACLNCRDEHLKCEGNLAGDSRCSSLNLLCHFVPSRRGPRARPAPMADYTVPPVVDVLANPLSLDTITPTDLLDAPPASSWTGSHLVAVYYQHFHLVHPLLPPLNVLVHSPPPDYLLDLMELISLHYLSLHMVPDCTDALQAAVRDAVLSIEKPRPTCFYRLSCTRANTCVRTAKRRKREIFIIDTLLAAVQVEGALQYTSAMPDVPLPCEEDKYHDGRLPRVIMTVSDLGLFDHGDLSSFAYRVEVAIVLRRCLLASETHVSQDSLDILDANIPAWFHRFPSCKRVVLQPNGEVNEPSSDNDHVLCLDISALSKVISAILPPEHKPDFLLPSPFLLI